MRVRRRPWRLASRERFQAALTGEPDLLVSKRVHSALYGQSDLDNWLQSRHIKAVAICGIATDHCCETTARMAGDLGYQTWFVQDATHAFDRDGPGDKVTARSVEPPPRAFTESLQPVLPRGSC